MRRRLAAAAALIGVLLLTGCDPYGPAEGAGEVRIDATLRGDGSAQVLVFLDASSHDDAQLRSWGEGAASRLLPDARAVAATIESNDGGYPFDIVEVSGAFSPGRAPEVRLDGRAAVGWLLDQGATRVSLTITPPDVASAAPWSLEHARGDGAWSWPVIYALDEAPVGALALTPQPWQAIFPVLLVLIAVGADVGSAVAFRRHRPTLGLSLAGAAFASPLGLIAVAGPTRLDHLAVAGWLPPGAYGPARWAMVLPLVAAAAAALIVPIGLVLDRPSFVGRPGQVFVAPPGWPEPPPGWRPPLGWQPDPSWPRPPAGWAFFRDDPVP